MIAALIVAAAAASSPPAVVASLGDGATVEWLRGEAPRLLALPRAGEGWARLATRLCGGAGRTAGLRAANATLANPRRGVRVRVPWKILAPDLRVKAAEALFPQDRRTTAGWEHVTVAPWGGDGESWWELAEWFCGAGSRYQTLREANPDVELYPPKGRRLLIPNAALLPEFLRIKPEAVVAAATPPSPPPGPSPSIRGGVTPRTSPTAAAAEQAPLEYRDGEAIYRLQPHEALYSAVVVRFTGQLNASDVNATALELARKSGVSDVTSIPVGYPIRIPYELLLPQFLPPDNPKRRAWEKEKEELAAIKRAIRAANLEGIQIILDAGHGGGDTGAVAGNVWESTYVFDVMNRLRRVLESETKATVWVTVEDPALENGGGDRDVLPQTRDQRLLVHPPYDLAEPGVGVPLRWILADSLFEKLRRQKVDSERIAFVSIHADSLHPSVRGLMVYVPSRNLRPTHARVRRTLWSCREASSLKRLHYSFAFRSRAEALSSQLGEAIVKAASRYGIPVHPYEPVRSSVVRGGYRWVPAVLKYSEIPSAVLVEICNLNNDEDRALLLTWRFREKLAHAIAAGLAEGFSR